MSDFQFANADELNNLGSASVRYKQNIEALTILRALKENEGTTPSNQPKRSKLYLPKTKSTLYAAQV